MVMIGFVPLLPGELTQCLNQLTYLSTPKIKHSSRAGSKGEWQRCLNTFSVEQEVEFLVPVSTGYLCQHKGGEMGDNGKRRER